MEKSIHKNQMVFVITMVIVKSVTNCKNMSFRNRDACRRETSSICPAQFQGTVKIEPRYAYNFLPSIYAYTAVPQYRTRLKT